MRFKHPAWIPIAWILSALNIGATWFAAQPAEPTHATIHALLAVLFALGAQRLATRRRALQTVSGEVDVGANISALRSELTGLGPGVGDDRMKRLEQAIDAIAVEVERVGEGQRYMAKKLAERENQPDRPV